MIPEIELVRHPETGEIIPEEWRDISGYEGLYEISNYGRVKSLPRFIKMENPRRRYFSKERMASPTIGGHGYPMLTLTKDRKGKQYCVHSLVANAFIPNPENKPEVNHKDGIRSNPHLYNLERVTGRENISHSVLNKKKGSKYLGVVFLKNEKTKKWRASIWLNGAHKYIGFFTTELEAHLAYQKALIEHGIKNKYAA